MEDVTPPPLGTDRYGEPLGVNDLEFATSDVSTLTGVGVSRLNYWDRTDVVWPSLLRPCVDGQKAMRHNYRGRVWSLLDVLVVDLVRQLREHGLSLQSIRRGIVRLEHDHGLTKAFHQALDPATPVVLVLQDGDLLLLDGEAAWSVIRERGQSIILNKSARHLGDAAVKLYTETTIIYRSINEPTFGSAVGA